MEPSDKGLLEFLEVFSTQVKYLTTPCRYAPVTAAVVGDWGRYAPVTAAIALAFDRKGRNGFLPHQRHTPIETKMRQDKKVER
jgi:hypothetical protein